MIDVDKQVAHWQSGSQEDWEVAQELIDLGRVRHALFFAHLSLEKMLKAHVCRETKEVPPKIHNLLVLAQKARLPLSDAQNVFIGRFDRYQVEGRYMMSSTELAVIKAKQEMVLAKEFMEWLMKQL